MKSGEIPTTRVTLEPDGIVHEAYDAMFWRGFSKVVEGYCPLDHGPLERGVCRVCQLTHSAGTGDHFSWFSVEDDTARLTWSLTPK